MSPFGKPGYTGLARTRTLAAFAGRHAMALNVVAASVLFAMAVTYIVQVNASVAKGYAMRDLEQRIHELTLENQRMEVEVRKAQSLEHVAFAVKILGLVPAEHPEYVPAANPAYALAE